MAAPLPTAARPAVLAIPNVTPMIDVMLVLLIIFMLVTPALSGAVVTLPEGMHAVPRPEEVKDRTLTIDATGAYALNGSVIAAAELPARLAEYVRAYPTDRVLYVRADQGLEYHVVSEAMDAARASGIVAVGMVTEVPRVPGRRRATSP